MSPTIRTGIFALAIGGFCTLTSAQPVTGVRLPAQAQGSAAINALGTRLPDVARAYGYGAQELVTLFQTQSSLAVDQDGALLYICDGLSVSGRGRGGPQSGLGEADSITTPSSTLVLPDPGTDAFALQSFPGSSKVIYLDFNGHTTTGTPWNTNFSNGAPIVSQPFDQDGDPSTFSAAERDVIRRIWQRVAEDYAPFAVNVTTQDPGIEALRRSPSTDTVYGVRAVISPTNWYNSSAGGVGYLGSFNWDSDTPVFSFTQQLANSERYVAEATSHEVGHAFKLSHDGGTGTGYYEGHGNWAPIMGVGYYKAVTQFSKGEYTGANNTQDDLAIIASYVPYATDDHSNSTTNATPLNGANVSDGGTIESLNDQDFFRIDTTGGTIALNLSGPSPSPNLDIKAELRNASGQVLVTSDPAGLAASINFNAAAGTYYLRVTGVGAGDPLSTGYSNYGSVGNYVITGSFPAGVAKQAPTAVATASATSGTTPLAVSFTGSNSTDSDGTIVSYAWNFGNGATSTLANPTYTYTSAGTFTAVLTVTDNDGLTNTASVVISATAPGNVAPVASASASTTSGTAPLAITFSGSASYDPDGTIASYQWNFGDGSAASGATANHTFASAGTYTVTLTVTDNSGATASSTLSINVTAPATATSVDVAELTLTTRRLPSGSSATAAIVVRDASGQPVQGATVAVQWSGLVSGSGSATSDANGRVALTSPKTKKSGTITATVTNLTPPTGATYNPGLYSTPLSASIQVQ